MVLTCSFSCENQKTLSPHYLYVCSNTAERWTDINMHENQGCYWLIYLFKEAKQVILISDKFPHPTPYTPTTPNPFASQWFGPLPTRSHPRSHLEVCRVGVFLQVCDWWSSKYIAIIYLQTMFGQTFIVFYFILLHFTPQKNQTQLLFCCIFLISFFFFFF